MTDRRIQRQPESELAVGTDLILRGLDRRHAERVAAAVDANRAHLRGWLPWVDRSRTSDDSLRFLREMEVKREDGTALLYGLFSAAGELVGVIDLHEINRTNGNAQIGYWLTKQAEGRGLMSRACRAVLGMAFGALALERVEIRCAVGNHRSCAIPERLGFQFEGVLRHAEALHGGYVDLRLYSLLASEYWVSAEKIESGL